MKQNSSKLCQAWDHVEPHLIMKVFKLHNLRTRHCGCVSKPNVLPSQLKGAARVNNVHKCSQHTML